MRRPRFLIGAMLCALLLVSSNGISASTRSSPTIEQLFRQAVSAVGDGKFLQATQLLTRLIVLPEHIHSARAQELLGNVRESNGQLAHAMAEYRIYLERYPEGPGAGRVQARIDKILRGDSVARPPEDPAKTGSALADAAAELKTEPAPKAVKTAGHKSVARGSRPLRADKARASQPKEEVFGPEYKISDRGRVSLTYRYNEQNTRIADLTPAPGALEDEEFYFDNTLTTSLYFSRLMENNKRRVTLTFSGALDYEAEEDEKLEWRLYEASASFEDKASGRVLSFGRLRLKPTGIAYRLDGVSLKYPTSRGPTIGLFAGGVVESSRDMPFEDGRYLVGASVTYEDIVGENSELSFYLFEQREGSYTDRRVLGAEAQINRDWGGVFANAEYDLKFNRVNRLLLTGTRVFADRSRLTGRLSYYHSPSLSLRNALIGQTAGSLDALSLAFTEDELEQLAADRASEIKSLGLNYYRNLNDKWDLSLDGTLFHTSGTPASGGVAAVAADGTRTYLGVRVIGSSVFRERDRVDFGLRYSNSSRADIYVFDTSMRFPVNEKLSIRPRVRIGYEDQTVGDEKYVIPSVDVRYRFNRETSLQVEAGGRFGRETTATTSLKSKELFFTAGISRSF